MPKIILAWPHLKLKIDYIPKFTILTTKGKERQCPYIVLLCEQSVVS